MIQITNWDVVDWSHLSAKQRKHIKIILSRLSYLFRQAASLSTGARTYYVDERMALEWLLSVVAAAPSGATGEEERNHD